MMTSVTHVSKRRRRHGALARGQALIMALVLTTIGLALIGGVLAFVGLRQNSVRGELYQARATNVAEAVVEYAAVRFQQESETSPTLVDAKAQTETKVPVELGPFLARNQSEMSFSMQWVDATGGPIALPLSISNNVVSSGPYAGLSALSVPIEIIAESAVGGSTKRGRSQVRQRVSADLIPLFQFGLFFEGRMEANPGPDMTMRGPVHVNGSLHASGRMHFQGQVTVAPRCNLPGAPTALCDAACNPGGSEFARSSWCDPGYVYARMLNATQATGSTGVADVLVAGSPVTFPQSRTDYAMTPAGETQWRNHLESTFSGRVRDWSFLTQPLNLPIAVAASTLPTGTNWCLADVPQAEAYAIIEPGSRRDLTTVVAAEEDDSLQKERFYWKASTRYYDGELYLQNADLTTWKRMVRAAPGAAPAAANEIADDTWLAYAFNEPFRALRAGDRIRQAYAAIQPVAFVFPTTADNATAGDTSDDPYIWSDGTNVRFNCRRIFEDVALPAARDLTCLGDDPVDEGAAAGEVNPAANRLLPIYPREVTAGHPVAVTTVTRALRVMESLTRTCTDNAGNEAHCIPGGVGGDFVQPLNTRVICQAANAASDNVDTGWNESQAKLYARGMQRVVDMFMAMRAPSSANPAAGGPAAASNYSAAFASNAANENRFVWWRCQQRDWRLPGLFRDYREGRINAGMRGEGAGPGLDEGRVVDAATINVDAIARSVADGATPGELGALDATGDIAGWNGIIYVGDRQDVGDYHPGTDAPTAAVAVTPLPGVVTYAGNTAPVHGNYINVGDVLTNNAALGLNGTYNPAVINGAGVFVPDVNRTIGVDTAAYPLRAVSVRFASDIPVGGLTVASHHPVYTFGDVNHPAGTACNDAGWATYTAGVAPGVAMISDAVSVFSVGYDPWGKLASTRAPLPNAASTCLRMSIMVGDVPNARNCNGPGAEPTDNEAYSGGPHNIFRMNESWSGTDLFISGSIVKLWYSAEAKGRFTCVGGCGTNFTYNPPTRKWGFDTMLTQPQNLPPGTPKVQTITNILWTRR